MEISFLSGLHYMLPFGWINAMSCFLARPNIIIAEVICGFGSPFRCTAESLIGVCNESRREILGARGKEFAHFLMRFYLLIL